MKIAEVRDMTKDQLKDQLLAYRKEQLNLRFQKASGQMDTPSRITFLRKEVARIKTVQREQETRG